LSEELWAAPRQPGGPKVPAVSQPGQSDLPTFSERLKDVPEFWCEAPHWLDPDPPQWRARPGDSDQDEEKAAPKSRSATRRRQRQVLQKWIQMNRKNNDSSRPVIEAICKWSPCTSQLPPARRGKHSENMLPPPPPPPSPRKQKRRSDCDAEDGSGDEAEDADSASAQGFPTGTKVSL